jgi:nitroreductase
VTAPTRRHGPQHGGELPLPIAWNDTLDVLLSHRSTRAYLPDSLPEGTLETLVAAAQSAVSSSNHVCYEIHPGEDLHDGVSFERFLGGYLPWMERAGRFRSLGDGQIDFTAIFSKFAQYDFPGWAVVEWECVLKHPEDGAREGARFVREHIIRTTDRAFDDFAGGPEAPGINRRLLGLDRIP